MDPGAGGALAGPHRGNPFRPLLPLFLAAAAFVFWDSAVLWPLRVFVVFLHEVSHGLAAVLTGGSIESIQLSPDEGGLCTTRGGILFFVLSAGYLGSLGWGVLLLVVAARTRADRAVLGLVAAGTLLVTLVYVRSVFGFLYGLAAGGVLLLLAWKGTEALADLVLSTIGTVSCLYAPWDIASDLLLRSVPQSDANALGELTFIPGVVWGVLWMGIAVAGTAWAFWTARKRA